MMEYTEGLMRELENLVHFEKTDSLTEVGKKRIVALRKCRDDFKKLHLPNVVGSYSEKDMDDAYDKGFKDAMIKYRKD